MTDHFDERMRQERLVQAAASDAQARRLAEFQKLMGAALEKMGRLAADFARRADQIGWEPCPIVHLEPRDVLVKDGLFTRHVERPYCFVEVIGEGWVITDRSSLDEYNRPYTQFIVLKDGHWINIGHTQTPWALQEGKDIPGLPRELKRLKLVTLRPSEGSGGVKRVFPSFIMDGKAEDLLIKQLILEEDSRGR